VVGSYRRGKKTCGDIDILVCRHDGSIEAKLMQNLIKELEEKKFITESLTTPKLFDGKNCSAYMGVCYFEG
jgi:DNA polymerase lambda